MEPVRTAVISTFLFAFFSQGCGASTEKPPAAPSKASRREASQASPFPEGYSQSQFSDDWRQKLSEAIQAPEAIAALADMGVGLHFYSWSGDHASFTACDVEGIGHLQEYLEQNGGLYSVNSSTEFRCDEKGSSCLSLEEPERDPKKGSEFLFETIEGVPKLRAVIQDPLRQPKGYQPDRQKNRDEARDFVKKNRKRCVMKRVLRNEPNTNTLWTYLPSSKRSSKRRGPIVGKRYCGRTATRKLRKIVKTLEKEEEKPEMMWEPNHWYCDDDITCHFSGNEHMVEFGFSSPESEEVSYYAVAPSGAQAEGYDYEALEEKHQEALQNPCK